MRTRYIQWKTSRASTVITRSSVDTSTACSCNTAFRHGPLYIHLYSPKMVAIRKQNKNLTNLTKMLRNSPQFTTIIQYTEHHHHTHTAVYNKDCHTDDNYLEIY